MEGLRRDKKRSSPAPAGLNPTDEFKLRADGSRAEGSEGASNKHAVCGIVALISAHNNKKVFIPGF